MTLSLIVTLVFEENFFLTNNTITLLSIIISYTRSVKFILLKSHKIHIPQSKLITFLHNYIVKFLKFLAIIIRCKHQKLIILIGHNPKNIIFILLKYSNNKHLSGEQRNAYQMIFFI